MGLGGNRLPSAVIGGKKGPGQDELRFAFAVRVNPTDHANAQPVIKRADQPGPHPTTAIIAPVQLPNFHNLLPIACAHLSFARVVPRPASSFAQLSGALTLPGAATPHG